MDANLFLQQFGQLAQSPDGVQKLRNLILELAVRGKLVPQNPDDEPASELLKRIEAEKANLIRAGRLKKADKIPPIEDDEKPYVLPRGWSWIRLGEIQIFVNGFAFKSSEYRETGIGVLRIGDIVNRQVISQNMIRVDENYIRALDSSFQVQPGSMVIAMSGATTGKIGINKTEEIFLLNQRVGKIIPILVSRDYLSFCLQLNVEENLAKSVGSAIPNLSTSQINDIKIPLPPLAEQHRIVAKVDELMQLCDQLEQEQTHRDHLREHAAQSTLHHLTAAATPAETLHYWQQAEQHFDGLFDRVSTVADLRAAILELAVRGRLVPQDPAEEPASRLLERIEAEKADLVRAGLLKKADKLPPIDDDEKPYELPNGWEWGRLESISISVSDGDHQAPPKTSKGIPFLVISNVVKGYVDIEAASRFVPIEYYEGLEDYRKPNHGDILYTVTGSIGVPVIVDTDVPFCFQRHIGIIKPAKQANIPYVHLALSAPSIKAISINSATGIAQKTIPLKSLRQLPLPIPPLAEQYRIVAKVDELMQLCDQLEQQAEHTHQLSAKLMDSVIYHLFEPAAAL